jgi:hypothetical protein
MALLNILIWIWSKNSVFISDNQESDYKSSNIIKKNGKL